MIAGGVSPCCGETATSSDAVWLFPDIPQLGEEFNTQKKQWIMFLGLSLLSAVGRQVRYVSGSTT